jgi:hypothetical protein
MGKVVGSRPWAVLRGATFSLVETIGFEPTTSCVQSRRSSQLSYVPRTNRSPPYQAITSPEPREREASP